MADIGLVIRIPEEKYLYAKSLVNGGKETNPVVLAIGNGTPLQRGHGDIVDIKTLIDMFWDGNSMEITKDDLSVIKPIIEADKEREEE
jgi:hypothetical protein